MQSTSATLGFPCGAPRARVDRRVPKTLLVEHGAPTAADRRRIESLVEELRWVASLKPAAVGLAPYRDDTREAVELALLTLRLRPGGAGPRAGRLVELVHRAVPYHLLLVTIAAEGGAELSLADKRWAQNEPGRVVLDGDVVRLDLAAVAPAHRSPLLASLGVGAEPRAHLYALYRGWVAAVEAARAAALTGSFTPAGGEAAAAERREALRACEEIAARIKAIQTAASREKQLPRLVELNAQLTRLRAELSEAQAKL